MNVVSIGKRAASSIEKLSPEGRELVETMLSDGGTYAEVIAALRDKTGEEISRSALSRFRRSDFEPTRQRIEAARTVAIEVTDLLKDSRSVEEKFDASAQGLFNILLSRTLEMKTADVTKLSREARMFQTVRLAQRKADMSEQKLDLDRQKLELERRELDRRQAEFDAKQQKAKQALAGIKPGHVITQDQFDLVQSVYGVNLPS